MFCTSYSLAETVVTEAFAFEDCPNPYYVSLRRTWSACMTAYTVYCLSPPDPPTICDGLAAQSCLDAYKDSDSNEICTLIAQLDFCLKPILQKCDSSMDEELLFTITTITRDVADIKKENDCYEISPVELSVEARNIVVREGDLPGASIEIRLARNPLVGCKDKACDVRIVFEVIEDETASPKCSDGTPIRQLLIGSCGMLFTENNWNISQVLTLTARLDRKIDGDQTVEVKVNALLIVDELIVVTKPIKVYKVMVIDRDSISQCSSINDPHHIDFQSNVFDNFNQGEFTMYRHSHYPMEIRAVFTTCVFGKAVGSCNCELSVKNADDVFVVNLCHGTGYKIKTKPTMWRNGPLLPGFKVYSKIEGRQFVVITSTGTKVVINLEKTQTGNQMDLLNFFIVPSVLDLDYTEGICGNHSGKESTVPVGDKETGKYWQSSREDVHFYGVPENPYSLDFGSLCQTSDVDGQCSCDTANLFEDCDLLSDATDVTETIQTGPVSETRKKRAVGDPFAGMNVNTSAEGVVGSFPTTSGITLVQASETCTTALTDTAFYDACSSVISKIIMDSRITNCVADIKISDGFDFVQTAVNAMITDCQLTAATLNNSTLVNQIADVTCPLQCSGHGSCSNGRCTCDDGFKAVDCSIDIGEAPDVQRLAATVCASTEQSNCKNVTLYGADFVSDATCHFEIVQLTTTGVNKIGSTTMTVPATWISFDEVVCNLVGSLPLHTVLVSVSNNGVAASAQHLYIAYNTDCFKCTWLSQAEGTCEKERASCYVDGVCYRALDQSVSEECFICDARTGNMVYNVSDDCKLLTTTEEPYHASQQDDDSVIIGTSVGIAAILFIIIVVAIMVMIFKYMQKTHRASEKKDHRPQTSEEGEGSAYPAFANYGYQGYPAHGYPAMYLESPQDVFVNSIPKRHHSRHADPTRNNHTGGDNRRSQQEDYFENPYISHT